MKAIKKLGLCILMISISLVVLSCDITVTEKTSYTVYGSVEDGNNSSTPFNGLLVKFTNSSNRVYVGTVGTNNTYKITNIPTGQYTITATKAGYRFVSNSVYISREGQIISPLVALSTSSVNNYLSVNGSVLNVKDDSNSIFQTSFSGLLVKFTDNNNVSYSATVNSNNNYNISNIPGGQYTITATKLGYTFLPCSIDLSGNNQTAPLLKAIANPTKPTVTFVLEWENYDVDLDLHATFGPEVNNNQNHVFFSNKSKTNTDGVYSLKLDRDIVPSTSKTYSRVETISLSIDNNPLSNTWYDEVRLYVDSYNKKGGLTGDSSQSIKPANATVYAMLYDGTKSIVYGIWKLPTETYEQTLRVAKVFLKNNSGVVFTLHTDMINPGDANFRSVNTEESFIGIPSEIR